MNKSSFKAIKQLVFLQRSTPLVFFLASSTAIDIRNKFIMQLEIFLGRKFQFLKLNVELLKKKISQHSFWYAGNIICIDLQDFDLRFVQFLKTDSYLAGHFFFLGFKYLESCYYYGDHVVLERLFKLNNVFLYSSVYRHLYNVMFNNVNLLKYWLEFMYNILYANIKSTFYWMSFWKEKTA